MSCDCPLKSVISGSAGLLFAARGAAAISHVIVAACLWQVVRDRSAIQDFLRRQHLAATWTRMLEELGWPRPDDHTRKVREVVANLQEDRCGTMIQFGLCWFVMSILLGNYQIHVTGLWSDDVDLDSLSLALLDRPLLRQIPLAAVVVMLPVSSKVVKAQFAQVAFVLTSICMQWLHTDLYQQMTADSGDVAGRIFFAVFLGTPLPVFMLNASMLGSTVIRHLYSDEFPAVSGGPVIGAILAVTGALLSQKILHSEARAIVAKMTSVSSEAAVQDLLGIMCDAVVVLDEDLVVASPCPKLDALLLLDVPVHVGGSGTFPSLFQETDQDRVRQFLAGCTGEAQSLHANLRDVRGSCLGVQLFHKPFEDVFGKIRHVIGVQEETDDAHLAQPWTHENIETPRLRDGNWILHQRHDRSDRSWSGSRSSISSGSIPISATGREDRLEVQFDISSENLRIITCTASVTNIIGSTGNRTGLLDIVAESEKAPLLRWVKEGGSDPMRLTLQHTRTASLTHRATCMIRSGSDADAPAVRCLLLSNLRCRWHASASNREARGTDIQGTERCLKGRMSL